MKLRHKLVHKVGISTVPDLGEKASVTVSMFEPAGLGSCYGL